MHHNSFIKFARERANFFSPEVLSLKRVKNDGTAIARALHCTVLLIIIESNAEFRSCRAEGHPRVLYYARTRENVTLPPLYFHREYSAEPPTAAR